MNRFSTRTIQLTIGTVACLEFFLCLSKLAIWSSEPEKARENVIDIDPSNPRHNAQHINTLRHTTYPIIEMVATLLTTAHCFFPRIYRFSLQRKSSRPINGRNVSNSSDFEIESQVLQSKFIGTTILGVLHIVTITMGAVLSTKVRTKNILDWTTLGFDILLGGMLVLLGRAYVGETEQLILSGYGGHGLRGNGQQNPETSSHNHWRSHDRCNARNETLPLYEQHPNPTTTNVEDVRINPGAPSQNGRPLTEGRLPPYSRTEHSVQE